MNIVLFFRGEPKDDILQLAAVTVSWKAHHSVCCIKFVEMFLGFLLFAKQVQNANATEKVLIVYTVTATQGVARA